MGYCYTEPKKITENNNAYFFKIAACAVLLSSGIPNVNAIELISSNKTINLSDWDSQKSTLNLVSVQQQSIESNATDNDLLDVTEIVNLGADLGFNKTQWSKALGVSRETIQKWSKSPEMQPRESILETVKIFRDFSQNIKSQHKPFLGKLSIGILEISAIHNEIFSDNTSLESLNNLYDEYYKKFDGAYKRSII